MAGVYAGKEGIVWNTDLEINVRSWTLSTVSGVATGAHSSSAGWMQAVAGIKSWTASIEVYCDTTLAATAPWVQGATVALQLWDGSRNWIGSGVISGVDYSCDIEGDTLVTASVAVQGTDGLTHDAVTPS